MIPVNSTRVGALAARLVYVAVLEHNQEWRGRRVIAMFVVVLAFRPSIALHLSS